MARWRWLPWFLASLLVLAASACAKPPVVTERELVEESTPEPTDPKVAAAQQPPDDADLSRWLDQQTQPLLEERTLPDESPAAPTEPPEAPESLDPSPPTPDEDRGPAADADVMPNEGPLGSVDTGRETTALGGAGEGARRKAALSLTREGRDFLAEGNAYLAEKRFEKALSIDPQSGMAFLGLAELRFGEEKWSQAADLATKAALRMTKEAYFRSRAHLLAAKAMVNDRRPQAALQQARLAIQADPNNREAGILRVRLERFLGVESPQEN